MPDFPIICELIVFAEMLALGAYLGARLFAWPGRLFHKPDLWEQDCIKWRGRVLTGEQGHWCMESDGLPVDETTPEWPCGCSQQF